jgi:serine/threonine protein kinase
MEKIDESTLSKGFLFKNGKYEILRQIGEGGFGFVFLVKDKHDEEEERYTCKFKIILF